MRRPAATAALTLLGSALLLAGQTAQPPVFRSGVELVDVAVVVVDEDGRFVPGLTAADFAISERGVPQSITAVRPRLDPGVAGRARRGRAAGSG